MSLEITKQLRGSLNTRSHMSHSKAKIKRLVFQKNSKSKRGQRVALYVSGILYSILLSVFCYFLPKGQYQITFTSMLNFNKKNL